MKSRKEAKAELKLVLLSRKRREKGNRFTTLLTAYFEAREEVGVPGEIPFGGFACFFYLLGLER